MLNLADMTSLKANNKKMEGSNMQSQSASEEKALIKKVSTCPINELSPYMNCKFDSVREIVAKRIDDDNKMKSGEIPENYQ